jgi:hypothetical protein
MRAPGVDAGFVLAGITNERESPDLVSLGTVLYEPLWVFSLRAMDAHARKQRETRSGFLARAALDAMRKPA